jgi:hypothetical protein
MGKIRHASLDRSLPPMSEFSHKRKTLRIKRRTNDECERIVLPHFVDSRLELEGETY